MCTENALYLNQIFSIIDIPLVIFNEHGNIVFANLAWKHLYNLTDYQENELTLDKILSKQDAEAITSQVEKGEKFPGQITECLIKSSTSNNQKNKEIAVKISRIMLNGKFYAMGIFNDGTNLRRLEKNQSALAKISEIAGTVNKLSDLFTGVHDAISDLMPANNFYISLHDLEKDLLVFPYFVDEFDPPPPPQRLQRGLTEYVLRSGKPLLVTPEKFDQLVAEKEVENLGAPSIDWLGVPLKIQDHTIGIMAVQSYTEGVRFSANDLSFLSFVAPHVAMAIEKKRAEEELQKQHDLISTIFASSPNAILVTDTETKIIDCNQAEIELVGQTSKAELMGRYALEFVVEEERPRVMEDLQRLQADGIIKNVEYTIYGKNGKYSTIQLSASVINDHPNNRKLIVNFIIDITEKKEAEKALRTSEERHALAMAGANDGLWDWDLQAHKIYFSPRWKKMLGYEEVEICDEPEEWLKRVHPDDLSALISAIESHLACLNPQLEIEHRIRHKDGTYHWVLVRGLAISSPGNPPHRMAGSMTDITKIKLNESRLIHEALHDKLTGLPNRALFLDRLSQSIKRSRRHNEIYFAVLYLDLDRFKVVNDSLGHLAGDQMLISIARRLEAALRVEDTVARLGGDEFVVLLNDLKDPIEVVQVANRIQQELSAPYTIEDQQVFTTCSIGITLGSNSYTKPEEVLRDADTAMYQAKSRGGGRYEMFDRQMHAQAVALLHLESDLRCALDMQQFRLFYQPIVNLTTGIVSGAEALIRWDHPQNGMVFPGKFIPLAEETGLIIPIGDWVLRTACSQITEWKKTSKKGMKVAVNMSARQFQNKQLSKHISDLLTEFNVPSCQLVIEITESTDLAQMDKIENILWELKELGVGISIDDFGTGYSSLHTLRRLPTNFLKISQSFIGDIGNHKNNDLITASIIDMAHNLGMEVVAEGVETKEQLDFVMKHNCDHLQGFLTSPAIPPEIFSKKFLHEEKSASLAI